MDEKRKLTLKDIARDLGISVSTASRALKGHPDIAGETIEKVKAYAEKHNYVPNVLAVNFRKRKTYTIGLIVPELVHHFFSTVISGVIEKAKSRGYNVLVSQSNDLLEDEKAACKTMLASSVDGLLISISNESTDVSHIRDVLNEGKPVVQFDKISEQLNTPKVIGDDYKGAFLAMEHLIQQGYCKIAHLSGKLEMKNSLERYQAYKDALGKYGLPAEKDWVRVCSRFDEIEGYKLAKEIMESSNPPDAIFCCVDLIAIGVMKLLKEKGLQIPGDIGIMGFSNWKLAEVAEPALSTVEQHGYKMGQAAASLLIDSIEDGILEDEITEIIQTNLIIRPSSVKG